MNAYILDAVRTPIGRYGGALASVRTDGSAICVQGTAATYCQLFCIKGLIANRTWREDLATAVSAPEARECHQLGQRNPVTRRAFCSGGTRNALGAIRVGDVTLKVFRPGTQAGLLTDGSSTTACGPVRIPRAGLTLGIGDGGTHCSVRTPDRDAVLIFAAGLA